MTSHRPLDPARRGPTPRGPAPFDPRIEEHQLLSAAVEQHAAGRLDQADALYARVLRLNRRNPEALHRRALLKQAQGQPRDALDLLDRAIQVAPNQPLAHCHRGYILQDLGRRREAIASLQRAARLQPDFTDAYIALGAMHAELGDLANACASFDRAAQLEPRAIEPILNKAILFEKHGQPDAAIECLDAALRIAPDDPAILQRKAACLRQQGAFAEALRICDTVLAARPGFGPVIFEKGLILAGTTEYADAIVAFERAMALHHLVDACHYNIGNCLKDMDRLPEARDAYRRAIALRPDYPEAFNNLGDVLGRLHQPLDALAAFEQAAAIKPDFADAYWNAAQYRLQIGDYARGWRLYEWRWKTPQFASKCRSFREPLWLGDSDIAGKSILVWCEQGFGDMLLSVRYVPMVAARGARVILQVPAALQRLFERIPGLAAVGAASAELPAFDVQCPMMSLPLAFRTTLETIPADIPYLHADPARVANWRERLAALPGLKVGLVWAGSPTYPLDGRRSMALAQMAPFGTLRDVTFVSLQKDAPGQQARQPPAGLTLHDWTDELRDFDDTAALITALDLVISVDTALVHLTGALGKPVWVLDRNDSEWRWLIGRDDSPWYPTVRLFRQPQPGDWASVVERALAELSMYASPASGVGPRGADQGMLPGA